MSKFIEKDLERLNHAQLCQILDEHSVEYTKDLSKAQLKELILNIPEPLEGPIQDPIQDPILDVLNQRRQTNEVPTGGNDIQNQIALRRAIHNSTSVVSVKEAIASRRKVRR